jgi:Tfp pilus assembly protein PilW
MKRLFKGFTTVELLITMAIFGFVCMLTAEIFLRSLDFWHTTMTSGELCFDARLAVSRMARELYSATNQGATSPPAIDIPAAPNNNTIVFYLPRDIDGDGTILNATTGQIEWDTSHAIAYQLFTSSGYLVRIESGNNTILADNVEQLGFADSTMDTSLNADEVRITISFGKNTPLRRRVALNINTIVRLRN